MDIVALQPGTKIAEICKLVGSRKRKAILARPTDKVTMSGTCWDGGSKSDYWIVDLKAMQARPLPAAGSPVQFGGPKTDPVIDLEPHQAVVCTGFFCGKPSTPTIYFHTLWGQEALQQGTEDAPQHRSHHP